jgi:uncharacterized Zn-binding protein involved in type VI secretion
MTEIWRYHIRNGDTTTAHGRVQPKPHLWPTMYGDELAAYEGDPVWCPACKNYGVTKCVVPYRPDTGPDGRQASLDGDLCLCKCATPPRLIALLHDHRVGFSSSEVIGMQGAGAWLAYAGHKIAGSSPYAKNFDLHFRVHNEKNGEPLAYVPYRITLETGLAVEGITDQNGLTQTIGADSKLIAHLEIPYYGNSTSTSDSSNGQDACSC